jgi:predicted metal-binding protein
MDDRQGLERLFREHGCAEFTWIDPKEIVVAQWVRMKCIFGCDDYGANPVCPPNLPSVAECREFIGEYSSAVLFHFPKWVADPEDRHPWVNQLNGELSELEREVFLSGYHKAFMLFPGRCQFCSDCPTTKAECRRPEAARPSAEGLGIDVFSTVRKYGLPIKVLSDYTETMNWYAILLLE